MNPLQLISRYFHFWLKTSLFSIQASFTHRGGSFLFLLGKFLRFLFIFALIIRLAQPVGQVAGYTSDQLLVVFLVYNLFDLIGQIFFRGIYSFRREVISGELDFRLTKPINVLFQILTSNTDILDLPLFLLVIVLLILKLPPLSLGNLLAFVLLFTTGFIIITAFHILVAGLGILTTEVDHTIMIYRDLSNMARFPVEIYTDTIRAILTFIIPIAIAFSFPSQALLGFITPVKIGQALLIALALFYLSLQFWRYSIYHYSSASS